MNNGNTITTKCYWIGSESSQAATEMRVAVAATQVGQAPPVELSGGMVGAPLAPIPPRTTRPSGSG